jgi:ribosomal protein L25 (general stress protein Ctc)
MDKRGFLHKTRHYKKKVAEKGVKEEVEQIEEVWKATQNEKGEHVIKHHSGKVGGKVYGSKGEAIDAAVRLNKQNHAFKEEVDPTVARIKAHMDKEKF